MQKWTIEKHIIKECVNFQIDSTSYFVYECQTKNTLTKYNGEQNSLIILPTAP